MPTLELLIKSGTARSAVKDLEDLAGAAKSAETGARRLQTAFAGADPGMMRLAEEANASRAALQGAGSAAQPFAASLNELRRDVALMNADFRSGKLAAAEYAASMAATRGQVQALAATAGGASAAELGQLNGLLTATAPAAQKAGITINALRGPLATFATQSLGASSSAGQLGSILLSLGAGSVITIGVLAALAAIGAVMGKLKGDADALQKSITDLGDAFAVLQGLAAEKTYQDATLAFLAAADDLAAARSSLFRSDAAALAVYNEALAALLRATDALNQKKLDAAPQVRALREQRVAVDTFEQSLARLNHTFDEWLANQKRGQQLLTISGVLGRAKTPGFGADVDLTNLAAANRQAELFGKHLAEGADAADRALTQAKALGQEITQAVTGALQLADAFGLVDGSTARLLTTITQIATAANTMAKAIKAGSTGDIISAGLSIVGGLASLFGGGPSPEERERIRVQRENTEAVRLNTAAKELGTALTGNQLGSARSATNALLGLIPGGVGALPGSGTINNRFDQFLTGSGNGTFKDLVDLAKQLGIQLDTSSWQAAVDSLRALDAQLRQNELIRFTETFTGKMQALNAQFVIFGTVDPLTKLTAQLKVAGDIGSITHDAQGRLIRLPGTGSSAINAAGVGLDLATTAGRDQLTANLQALFKQLQAGTLAASALGGLTAQEFLDQLTGLIDLVKQAEDAARARERNLQDLEVRRLRATNQGSAADALAFQLTQQREYQDAVLAGADALTLSTLAEVQRAEALFRSTEAMQEAIDTLQTFGDSLKLDRNLTTLSPVQQLAEARRQYDALLAKAQSGDTAAAQALPDAARAFLEASRAVNASGPAFAADFAKVQSDTAALATMFADSIAVEQLIYETNKSMLDELKASNVELQTLVAVQAASAAELLAELKATRAENAANAIATKLALEGLSLA